MIAAFFAVALTLALAGFEFGARRIYDYAMTGTHLEVRLFGRMPIYRIARSEISHATLWRPSLRDLSGVFKTVRCGNRIFGSAVRIERQNGFPRYLIITPDDAPRMIYELNNAHPSAE